MTRSIKREARRTERTAARLRNREPMLLLPANARTKIAVHELDERPPLGEAAIDLESIHVVGEADIRGPALDRVERRVHTAMRYAELRKLIGRGRGKRRRLGIAMQDRHRM